VNNKLKFYSRGTSSEVLKPITASFTTEGVARIPVEQRNTSLQKHPNRLQSLKIFPFSWYQGPSSWVKGLEYDVSHPPPSTVEVN